MGFMLTSMCHVVSIAVWGWSAPAPNSGENAMSRVHVAWGATRRSIVVGRKMIMKSYNNRWMRCPKGKPRTRKKMSDPVAQSCEEYANWRVHSFVKGAPALGNGSLSMRRVQCWWSVCRLIITRKTHLTDQQAYRESIGARKWRVHHPTVTQLYAHEKGDGCTHGGEMQASFPSPKIRLEGPGCWMKVTGIFLEWTYKTKKVKRKDRWH